ncbi:hypothetical protein ACOMHN_059141 [Nucella lapillus]
MNQTDTVHYGFRQQGWSKKRYDNHIIRRIIKWVQNSRDALRTREPLSPSAKFVLATFMHKLCSIHRERMLCDDTGERPTCDGHDYLYITLRLTYEIDLTVKTNVSMLLREIFVCEGSLQAIFSMLFDPQWRTDVSMHADMLYPIWHFTDRSAFNFFVSNICPLRRDVREKNEVFYTPSNVLNRRFFVKAEPTTPLQAATTLGDPDLVLLLLRHGADPLLCYRGDLPQKSPVGFTIDTLNISTMLRGSDWSPASKGDAGETIGKALRCLTYFARAVFALDIRESSQTVDTTPRPPNNGRGRRVHFEVRPRVTEIIDLASFRQPPSLRHACRYIIRDAVTAAGRDSLPEALCQLQVPELVRKFLDLCC